jgi:hypothetical protein
MTLFAKCPQIVKVVSSALRFTNLVMHLDRRDNQPAFFAVEAQGIFA